MRHQLEETRVVPLPAVHAAPAIALVARLDAATSHPSVPGAVRTIVRAMAWVHGAHVVRGEGEEMVLVFGSVADALGCATGVQRALTAYARHRRTIGTACAIALHAGGSLLGEWDEDGEASRVASDLAALAAPGEILATTAIRELAGGGPAFGDGELAVLPHANHTVAVHAVTWAPQDGDSVDAALVEGFDRSRDALGPRLLAAASSGEGMG